MKVRMVSMAERVAVECRAVVGAGDLLGSRSSVDLPLRPSVRGVVEQLGIDGCVGHRWRMKWLIGEIILTWSTGRE
jgi:hypothetical protein